MSTVTTDSPSVLTTKPVVCTIWGVRHCPVFAAVCLLVLMVLFICTVVTVNITDFRNMKKSVQKRAVDGDPKKANSPQKWWSQPTYLQYWRFWPNPDSFPKVCGTGELFPLRENPSNQDMKNTPKRGEHPWLASIMANDGGGSWTRCCAGVYIANGIVLTSGWCVKRFKADELMVALGATELKVDDPDHQLLPVDRVRFYKSKYDPLALLDLANLPRESPCIQPICLPFSIGTIPDDSIYGAKGSLLTWSPSGHHQTGFNTKHEVMMILWDQRRMIEFGPWWPSTYPHYFYSYAASPAPSQLGPCQNEDIGSPLVMWYEGAWYLIGILQYTPECAKIDGRWMKSAPYVFTNSILHQQWIADTVTNLNVTKQSSPKKKLDYDIEPNVRPVLLRAPR